MQFLFYIWRLDFGLKVYKESVTDASFTFTNGFLSPSPSPHSDPKLEIFAYEMKLLNINLFIDQNVYTK